MGQSPATTHNRTPDKILISYLEKKPELEVFSDSLCAARVV